MIKINRNIESDKITRAKSVLKDEKQKASGDYNRPEVIDALKIVFNSKCYICENKIISSYNIEHLRPHRNTDLNLKFSWDNLFLSCAHCNNIKSDRYDSILDCTKVDVDEVIAFRKIGYFQWEEEIQIEPLSHDESIDETVHLLDKVYNGTTEMKKLESINIRKALRKEITKFIDAINEYEEAEGEDKNDAKQLVKQHLKSNSPFAAFKRWIIRDNGDKLSEFLEIDGMKIKIEGYS